MLEQTMQVTHAPIRSRLKLKNENLKKRGTGEQYSAKSRNESSYANARTHRISNTKELLADQDSRY